MIGTAKVRTAEAALPDSIPPASEKFIPDVRFPRIGDDDPAWRLIVLEACARISFIVLSWPNLGARYQAAECRFPLLDHGRGRTRRIFLRLQIEERRINASTS